MPAFSTVAETSPSSSAAEVTTTTALERGGFDIGGRTTWNGRTHCSDFDRGRWR